MLPFGRDVEIGDTEAKLAPNMRLEATCATVAIMHEVSEECRKEARTKDAGDY